MWPLDQMAIYCIPFIVNKKQLPGWPRRVVLPLVGQAEGSRIALCVSPQGVGFQYCNQESEGERPHNLFEQYWRDWLELLVLFVWMISGFMMSSTRLHLIHLVPEGLDQSMRQTVPG